MALSMGTWAFNHVLFPQKSWRYTFDANFRRSTWSFASISIIHTSLSRVLIYLISQLRTRPSRSLDHYVHSAIMYIQLSCLVGHHGTWSSYAFDHHAWSQYYSLAWVSRVPIVHTFRFLSDLVWSFMHYDRPFGRIFYGQLIYLDGSSKRHNRPFGQMY